MCSNFAILNGTPPGHHQRTQGIEVVAKAGSSNWHLFLRFGVLPLPRCAAGFLVVENGEELGSLAEMVMI